MPEDIWSVEKRDRDHESEHHHQRVVLSETGLCRTHNGDIKRMMKAAIVLTRPSTKYLSAPPVSGWLAV